MASEKNELTFVRCPTCRSLVPASASKCRICNATLDAGAKGSANEAPAASGGRVRQRTVSAGAEEVKNMVAASAPPPITPPPVAPIAAASSSSGPATASKSATAEAETFDPLGAFLEDLDASVEETKAPEAPPTPFESKRAEAPEQVLFDDDDDDNDGDQDDDEDDDDLDDFDLDIFDDPSLDDDDEEEEDEPPVAKKEVVTRAEEPLEDLPEVQSVSESFDDPEDLVQVEEPREAPPAPRREPPRPQAARPVEPARPLNRDVRPAESVKDGGSRPRPNQGARQVSPGNIRPKIGGMPERAEARSPAPRPAQPNPERAPQPSRSPEVRERPVQPEPRAAHVPQRAAGQGSPNQGLPSQGRNRPEANPPRPHSRPLSERPVALGEDTGVRAGKARTGRLLGWLVSYENPDGRAIELRAGRFFISGSSIRPTDLILEDQSISTPHALMSVSDGGIQVQDLMSERGTFVRLQGESQYIREDGIVTLNHGDWIRFGDVEFLVTIVPS